MPLVGSNWVGPLPGRYFNYALPILKDRTQATAGTPNDPNNLEGLFGLEVCYCKQPIAQFLGLERYPLRTGKFKTANNTNGNAGRLFAIRGGRGANQYKLILKPQTPVTIYVATPGSNQGTTQVIYPKSVSISVPRTVKVQEIRQWLALGLGQTSGTVAPDESQEWYKNVIGFITPTDRTYNLFESYEPVATIAPETGDLAPNLVEDIAGSPSPTP